MASDATSGETANQGSLYQGFKGKGDADVYLNGEDNMSTQMSKVNCAPGVSTCDGMGPISAKREIADHLIYSPSGCSWQNNSYERTTEAAVGDLITTSAEFDKLDQLMHNSPSKNYSGSMSIGQSSMRTSKAVLDMHGTANYLDSRCHIPTVSSNCISEAINPGKKVASSRAPHSSFGHEIRSQQLSQWSSNFGSSCSSEHRLHDEIPSLSSKWSCYDEIPSLSSRRGYLDAIPSLSSGWCGRDEIPSLSRKWQYGDLIPALSSKWQYGDEIPSLSSKWQYSDEIPLRSRRGYYNDQASSASSPWQYNDEIPSLSRRGHYNDETSSPASQWQYCDEIPSLSGRSLYSNGRRLRSSQWNSLAETSSLPIPNLSKGRFNGYGSTRGRNASSAAVLGFFDSQSLGVDKFTKSSMAAKSLYSTDTFRFNKTSQKGSFSRCNEAPAEHVRGPRAKRVNSAAQLPSSSISSSSLPVQRAQYNKSDFLIQYEQAKFFMIKSYSEDDIHKSVKYNVWSSTPNGNNKLDAAFHEAQEIAMSKGGLCPVFLFFSVNASGQFVGLAEMRGPVDFKKTMDFWQQRRWSGFFPVTWHIVKDIPNRHFLNITLENNDNRPVTFSRDTQEIGLAQGLKMLQIFKAYHAETCILDDFEFYEEERASHRNEDSLQMENKFLEDLSSMERLATGVENLSL